MPPTVYFRWRSGEEAMTATDDASRNDDRADYLHRLIAARCPELTDADLAALAEPLPAKIIEEIAEVIEALEEKERRLISQRTSARGAQGAGRQARRPQRQGHCQSRGSQGEGRGLKAVAHGAGGHVGAGDRGRAERAREATPSGGRWHAETVIRVQRRLEDLS
jgi:hypothetical protein